MISIPRKVLTPNVKGPGFSVEASTAGFPVDFHSWPFVVAVEDENTKTLFAWARMNRANGELVSATYSCPGTGETLAVFND